MQVMETHNRQKKITILCCIRCGSEWVQRFPDRKPKLCAICKSPYWDVPRV